MSVTPVITPPSLAQVNADPVPSTDSRRPRLLRSLSGASRRKRPTAAGELSILQWSADGDESLLTTASKDGHAGGASSPSANIGERATAAEKAAIEELRAVVRGDANNARWLEDGELLRFVRARKTLEQRSDLFREAMTWRKTRRNAADGSYGESDAGSFGGHEKKWCDGVEKPPDWWRFMVHALPFELFGADSQGIPVTYIGLGRMDLSGVAREIGLDKLEQKMVMQNDMFIDMARDKTIALSSDAGELKITHGGVFIIDCDGMGRRHLSEVRIFRHVSAALKVLHPERQRKTFIVRAPRIFSMVWKLIKPMLDARIISKINIIGCNDSLQPLVDELGPDNIPNVLGGNYQMKSPPSKDLIANGAFDDFLKHHP